MPNRRIAVVVAGIMLSLFMAAIEATVVATAMPTIVAQLGGLAAYSWVFSAYMLTSTTTVPLYGKLSDLYGRRRLFFVAMAIFLVGSVLCGMARSMEQLIAFRALQGVGAGGLMPLAFIIIGDILPFDQRARMQGLFSGVWGFAAIAGPLLGGFLVDQLSWRWVFLVNIVPGLLAVLCVASALREPPRAAAAARPSVDYAGAVVLSAGVVALLLGLFDLGTPTGQLLLGVALVFFAVLFWIERRAADPILPLPLLHERLFSVAVAQGALSGWALFGSTNFVPLFGQGVLGLSATAAGSALTPMMLCWTAASIAGGRLLLRFGYRPLALLGTAGLAAGAFMLTRLTADSTLLFIMVCLGVMGAGMGLAAPVILIAVQSSVQRARLGTATATLQFSRSMGGTLGVSVMGVILTAQLAASLAGAGASTAAISLGELIDSGRHAASAIVDSAVRLALADALNSVFVAAFIAAAIALGVTFLTPRGRIRAQPAPAPDAAPSPAPAAALRLTIRPAAAGDQPAITARVRAAKLNPFRLCWRDFLVAEMDGRIVGVGQVRPHGDGSRELASLVVASDHRGAGIGSQLVGALLAREAGPVYLFCREQLAAFYTPFGFERQDPRELPAALATMHRLAHWMTRAETLFVGRRVQIVAMRRPGSATTPPAI